MGKESFFVGNFLPVGICAARFGDEGVKAAQLPEAPRIISREPEAAL
jgi:hypothetical protein